MPEETRALVKHPGGRPSKAETLLTPEMLEAIGVLLAEGNYKETVCNYLGISRATWWNWEQRGEQFPDSLYGEFLDVVKKAGAVAEINGLRRIRGGGEGWQSSAWYMERRYPQRWGKRIDITIRQEAARIAAETGADPQWLIKRAEEIAAGAQRSG